MAKVIILNTEERHVSLGDEVLRPGKEFPRDLVPGLNEVDADAWNRVKRVPAVAGLIASGSLKEVQPVAPPAPPAATPTPTPPGAETATTGAAPPAVIPLGPGPEAPPPDPTPPADPPLDIPSPKDLKAADAIAMVQTTRDPATLEAWRAGETRSTVLAAIDAQLAPVAPPAPPAGP